MSFREAYYLHVHGEQIGPYTLRQIDHQLQTGLIAADTLYWSENLDQWQPVTSLIPLRKKPRPWRMVLIILAILLPFAGIFAFFGPTVLDGWREQTQREYSAEGAYWSARGVVRHELASSARIPQFLPISSAQIELGPDHTAVVKLEGHLLDGAQSGQPAAWKVRLHYDPAVRTWSPLPVPTAAR